jgi:monoamine oxidase
VVLAEAGDTLGGRLQNTDHGFDTGAAWVWQGQENVFRALQSLDIKTFAQPGDPQSTRVEGGTHALVDKLAEKLDICDNVNVKLGWVLESVEMNDKDDVITLKNKVTSEDETCSSDFITARKVVLAVPPRLLAQKVSFSPALEPKKLRAMQECRTWMAGVTKVTIEYPHKFWPSQMDNFLNIGLRGGPGTSDSTPAFQVYDASTVKHGQVALTFFALAPASGALDDDQKLGLACLRQLQETWAGAGVHPDVLQTLGDGFNLITAARWPLNPFISDENRPTTIHPHPHPVALLAAPAWGGKLLFAGTETDQQSPGVIEGALGSAIRVVKELKK